MRSNRLFVLLGALCIGLLGLLTWLLVLPPKAIDLSPTPTARSASSGPVSATQMAAGLRSYDELTARPLFTPTRRPPPPQIAKLGTIVQPPRQLPTLVLLGTIITDSERIAFVLLAGQPHGQAIRTGEIIEGWRVTEIRSDSLLLESEKLKHIVAAQPVSAPVPNRSQNSPPSPTRSNQIRR